MVRLKLKYKDDEKVQYQYRPEDKGEWGVVEMSFKDEKIKRIEVAEGDDINSAFYSAPCAHAIFDYIEANHFPEEDVRIWY